MPRNTNCQLCPLYKTVGITSVCVWGERTEPTRKPVVLCVGEAPGATEDKDTRPFVGKSGQLLRMILEEFGLPAYLSNVCKCRPPDNRTPKLPEIRACWPYLQEEVNKVKPQHILLLGATAIKAFTGERTVRVAEYRGRSNWVYGSIPVIATYHPAAALRDSKYVDLIVEDVKRIVSKEFIAPETPTIKHIKTVTKLPKKFAFDLETNQLSPDSLAKTPKILCVAWSDTNNKVSVTTDVRGFAQTLTKQIQTTELIGHNIKFDLLWLFKMFDLPVHQIKKPIIDTMIAAHLLDEEGNKGLKYLAGKLTGYGNYARDILPLRNSGKLDEVEENKLLTYCAYDAAATWKIHKILLPECEEQGLKTLLLTQGRSLLALLSMEATGLQIDIGAFTLLKEKLSKKLVTLKEKIKKTSSGEITNPGSVAQLRGHLYDTLGLPPVRFTIKGSESTDDMALEILMQRTKYPKILDSLREYRSVKKTLSTYLESYESLWDKAHTIHPWFNLTGTVTGRLSCSKPNLQNIPRDNPYQVKRIFVPHKGKGFLVQADYSQIELRVGAMLSNDKTMISRLQRGEDLHQATAVALFGKEAKKEERTIAKTINFGIFYGMGPRKLSETIGVSTKQARDFIQSWYQEYPGIILWMDRVTKGLTSTGYVATIFGRRRRLPVQVEDDRNKYHALLRQAINAPIQSTAAELTLLAVTRLWELQVPLVCTVHDSIIALASSEYQARSIGKTMKQVMENPEALCKHYGFKTKWIPTPVEISWGANWQDMEPLLLRRK